MIVNGVSELLSSQTTREVTLSCGLSLSFRKFRWKDYAQRENFIVSLRNDPADSAHKMLEVLKELERDDTEKVIEALMDMVERGNYAYFDEIVAFETSPMGKAYELSLITGITKEDAYVLLEASLAEEDRRKIDQALIWAKELPPLKNADGLSLKEEKKNLSCDGQDSSKSWLKRILSKILKT